jgi:glycosyltransferase involved in cell wall biosynthesis
MADAILALLRDDALRARLSAAGPPFAERFDWSAIARTLERCYLSVLDGAPRTAAASA